MGLMDKVKAQANQLAQQANAGMAKFDQAQHNRRADGMLRNLGAAVYAERTGKATAETPGLIDKLIADISAHEAQYGLNLAQTSEGQFFPGGGGTPGQGPGQATGFPGAGPADYPQAPPPGPAGYPQAPAPQGFPQAAPASPGFPQAEPAPSGFPGAVPPASFPATEPPPSADEPATPTGFPKESGS